MHKFKIWTKNRKGNRLSVEDIIYAIDMIEAREMLENAVGARRARKYDIEDCGVVELRVWAPDIAEMAEAQLA